MPTPVDELRTAGAKLRTHAERAADAPWTVDGWGCVATARHEEVAEVWPLGNGDHNAAYIAAVHPGVGTALADWLEATAAALEKHAPTEWHARLEPQALAVARQINGGAQ